MTIIDPWERAAQCERALLDISDSTRRKLLTNLHDLWVSLAEEGCWHSPEWDRELEEDRPVASRSHAPTELDDWRVPLIIPEVPA